MCKGCMIPFDFSDVVFWPDVRNKKKVNLVGKKTCRAEQFRSVPKICKVRCTAVLVVSAASFFFFDS